MADGNETRPGQLFACFQTLSASEREEFLKLLAANGSAQTALTVIQALPPLERDQYVSSLSESYITRIYPVLLKAACQAVLDNPDVRPGSEYIEFVDKWFLETTQGFEEDINELVTAKLKKKRDRRNDPHTVQRNLELIRLREENHRTWSYQKLGDKYGVKKQHAKRIVSEKLHWEKLGAGLVT